MGPPKASWWICSGSSRTCCGAAGGPTRHPAGLQWDMDGLQGSAALRGPARVQRGSSWTPVGPQRLPWPPRGSGWTSVGHPVSSNGTLLGASGTWGGIPEGPVGTDGLQWDMNGTPMGLQWAPVRPPVGPPAGHPFCPQCVVQQSPGRPHSSARRWASTTPGCWRGSSRKPPAPLLPIGGEGGGGSRDPCGAAGGALRPAP